MQLEERRFGEFEKLESYTSIRDIFVPAMVICIAMDYACKILRYMSQISTFFITS
jgi:hypothetical protein